MNALVLIEIARHMLLSGGSILALGANTCHRRCQLLELSVISLRRKI
jgi:hypothetical protein